MIVVQAPLRISSFGGGTDPPAFYTREPGSVFSTAIDKRVYVIVKERFDDLIYVNYSRKEIVGGVDELEHSLVREAMRLTGVDHGVVITMLADIPFEGSGLGSSSGHAPPPAQDAVRDALRDDREVPVGLERDGVKVILNVRQ